MSIYICTVIIALLGTFLFIFTKLNSNSNIKNYETTMKLGNKLFMGIKVNQINPQIEKATKLQPPNDISQNI